MPRNKYQVVDVLPPASQFGRGECVIYQGEVLTSDGVNWTSQTGPLSYDAATLPDPATLGVGDSAVLTGTFAADVTAVSLTVNYVKGVKSWTGTVVSANDPVDADGLPNGVTWVKV